MLYDPKWETPTKTAPSPTALVLIEARKLIEDPDNWFCCGKSGNDQNCAQTAITRVTGHRNDQPALDALMKAIGVHTLSGIYQWNDAPERTHAEVLAAFDRAIAAA